MYSLEEIKNKKFVDKGEPNFVTKEEFKWLIEQAEKAEKLQKENTKLNKVIGKYVGKISDISEELGTLAKELMNE